MFYPKNVRGATEPWLHLPVDPGEYKAGQLVMVGSMPYLCMADTTLEEGNLLPVQPSRMGEVYVTTLAEDAPGLKVGSRMTFADGLMGVTQADDDGFFTVEYLAGTTAGSEVHVRLAMM